jgi:transcription elongation factor GreA
VRTTLDREQALLVTPSGYEELRAELEALSGATRSEVIDRLRSAREDGDLADNPALYELFEEQAQLERRIGQLEEQLALAQVVEPNGDGTAGIGNLVRLRDLGTGGLVEYELVGAIEARVGNGRISVEAPVGRALVGARAGEVVEVETPGGLIGLEIVHVDATPARKVA